MPIFPGVILSGLFSRVERGEERAAARRRIGSQSPISTDVKARSERRTYAKNVRPDVFEARAPRAKKDPRESRREK
jgi:hypothetical protein